MAQLPVELGDALSARLLQAIRDASPNESHAGPQKLQAVVNNPAVPVVVLALRLAGAPAASRVQVVYADDPLANWADLACI